MTVLLQLLNAFGIESIESWCELIAQDETEIWEFDEILRDNDCELTDSQLDRLLGVIKSGKYKAGISMFNLKMEA